MTRLDFSFLLNCLFTSRAIWKLFLTSLDFEFLKAGFRTFYYIWSTRRREKPLMLYIIMIVRIVPIAPSS